MRVDLSEAGQGVSAADAVLTNRDTNQVVPLGAATFVSTDTSAEWRLSLSDGRYRLTLPSAATADAAGNVSNGYSHDFIVRAGDASRDGRVNFPDLLTLAQHYNQTGRSFGEGNFDYSPNGKVDFADLLLLAQRYGTSMLAALADSGIEAPVAVVRTPTPSISAPVGTWSGNARWNSSREDIDRVGRSVLE